MSQSDSETQTLQQKDTEQQKDDNESEEEKTLLVPDATANTEVSEAPFNVKSQPCITLHTGVMALYYSAIICLNALAVIYYDKSKFNRAHVFWFVFIFAYLSNLDGFKKWDILRVAFDVAQYLIYLWFSSWLQLALIVYSILLFVRIGLLLAVRVVYKFGVNEQSYLIHKLVHQRENEYKLFLPGKWYNGFELVMFATTVPMFYFDQTRVWGEEWYAIIVVIVLWYHRFTGVASMIYQDCYVRDWMHELRQKYHEKFDQKKFELELKRPIKEYDYQQIVTNIIPITYNFMLFIMLVLYFIQYPENQMSDFEYVYGVILTLFIGGSFAYFVYGIYSEATSKGKKTLQEILDDAMKNPKLSDLYGTWTIDTEKHACLSFTLKEENEMEVAVEEVHKLAEEGCCSHDVIDIFDSCIVGAIQLPLKETVLRTKKPPFYFRFIQPEAYKFVLHKNGIIKFVPIGDSMMHKLGLARLDSQGWLDLFKNVKHANKYTCFCLGILSKDGNIKRYNRWNTDLEYFYTATRQSVTDNDVTHD